MKTEEDEAFEEIERKQRRRIEDDDDIQDYKKPWVGLTELEGRAIAEWHLAGGHPIKAVIEAVEAKLKEKNT